MMEEFLAETKLKSEERIKKIHHLSKKIWENRAWAPIELRNKCLDIWDEMSGDLNCSIVPLISLEENQPISNLIFGSGSFSTGEFQAKQYEKVKSYTLNSPIVLQGIVSNKSKDRSCNASEVCDKYKVPLIELDFIDWYHEFIDKSEQNPIRATRYWYTTHDDNNPPISEIHNRFKIRQDQFHKSLGELIAKQTTVPTNLVSARGYNFQFCSNLFLNQKNKLPHINDTHPADLTFVDRDSHEKKYAGWQSGAIQLMMDSKVHQTYRGSLIEVDYMDSIEQINTLDEGSLLALSEGVTPKSNQPMTAKHIQDAMKVLDDYFYCTLEPTGLLLLWGITEKPVPVVYQDIHGKPVIIKQRAIVVGNKFRSGIHAWGQNLENDLKEMNDFLFP
ncbi:hypothetical protein NEF87_004148 [Candidatus Lokiarchaeum ossiferum]|uniref:Uncharacterized protein n=1 Tax=Candidatus Lokiarchaeum ossiferum TaxID=2951803 RepID=A0ABY6HWF1_9ARCH|nr:hypothetical protein NEF87_004148 [Candidatus Lokiarchaeum sp. B-35]